MKRARLPTLLTCVLAVLSAAWGRDGHKIVGEIAWTYLTPGAKAAVKALLENDPQDKTLADAATWADRIKSDRSYDWARPLHYVNVEPGSAGFKMERDCSDGECVVAAITKYATVLRSNKASKADQLEALKFLAHFVGDLHQPLHVSHAKDKGANDIAVEFLHNRTNLHRVWDSGILRVNGESWRNHAKKLRDAITSEQLEKWQTTDVSKWATESYKLAVSNAYKVPRDGKLGKEYFTRSPPDVEERLKMGGIRLAKLLNEIYAEAE